jgi:hypothetical protein
MRASVPYSPRKTCGVVPLSKCSPVIAKEPPSKSTVTLEIFSSAPGGGGGGGGGPPFVTTLSVAPRAASFVEKRASSAPPRTNASPLFVDGVLTHPCATAVISTTTGPAVATVADAAGDTSYAGLLL